MIMWSYQKIKKKKKAYPFSQSLTGHSCIYTAVVFERMYPSKKSQLGLTFAYNVTKFSVLQFLMIVLLSPGRTAWGSNGAAGALAVLTVVPQSSTAHDCCVITSLLRQAWSEETQQVKVYSSSFYCAYGCFHVYYHPTCKIKVITVINLPEEDSYLRFSLLGLKFWKLCLAGAWIGMKPCLLSFSGAESAWYMKWFGCKEQRACLTALLAGKQRLHRVVMKIWDHNQMICGDTE